jgi:hypothetical protein
VDIVDPNEEIKEFYMSNPRSATINDNELYTKSILIKAANYTGAFKAIKGR